MDASTADQLAHLVEVTGEPEVRFILARKHAGLGEAQGVLTLHQEQWTVCQPRSELGLRRILWKANGAPVLAVVDDRLADRLPYDLVRRARKRRIVEVEPTILLELKLGVPLAPLDDKPLVELALRHADRIQEEMRRSTVPTLVDRKLLEELLCDALLGKEVRTAEPGLLLGRWLASLPAWLDTPEVVALARRILPTYQGIDGRLLAWALEVTSRLRDIVIFGALLEVGEDAPPVAWGPLRTLAEQFQVDEEIVRKRAVALAEQALEKLESSADALLREAENRGRKDLGEKMLARSTLLPLGLDNRMQRLAERLAHGEDLPASEFDGLRRHRAARRREAELATLDEMARLVRFMAAPVELPGTVAEHVRQYQVSGAFSDVAASRLQRLLAGSRTFATQARKVLERWRTVRDAQNEAFARCLAGNYLPALKADGIVPLHRAWTEVALKKTVPLYVIVLDGCSYPVFLELVTELASDTEPVGLRSFGLDGQLRAMGIPALAPLPTITSHARSAFFLGEIPKDPLLAETVWREQRERSTDPGRFKQNPALGTRSRRLFLKGDLGDGGEELMRVLNDKSVDVVAAVFNAVDDQIGSANTGAVVRLEPKAIAGFVPALRAALEAGRAVLVTADHGHTPFVSKEGFTAEGASARFRELGPGDRVPPGFIEVDLQGTGGTPGRKAFAWKMGTYQGSPQVGFHGGCSLEEMVIPLAWLERDAAPPDEPSWWRPRPAVHAVAAPEGAPTQPERTNKPAYQAARRPSAQPEFSFTASSGEVAELAARAAQLQLPTSVLEMLDQTERAILVLLAENKSVRLSDLARRVGRSPARFGGLMTQLHRKLHKAQAPRFRVEPVDGGEQLFTWSPPPGGTQ